MEKAGTKTGKRDPKVYLIGAIVAFAVAAAAGVSYFSMSPQSGMSAQTGDAGTELSRLAALAAAGSLSVDDLSSIKSMLGGNASVSHGLEELETMVEYGELEHAGHTIGFIDGYLRTGKQAICPEHELSHYYVFTKHGEAELAEHALEHAEEQLVEWEPNAREFDEKYPSKVGFDERLADIQSRLESIESGGPLPSDEDALELAGRAICVGSESVHEEHSEEEPAEDGRATEEGHA